MSQLERKSFLSKAQLGDEKYQQAILNEEERRTEEYDNLCFNLDIRSEFETITYGIHSTFATPNQQIIMLEVVHSNPKDFQSSEVEISNFTMHKQNDLVQVQIFCIH